MTPLAAGMVASSPTRCAAWVHHVIGAVSASHWMMGSAVSMAGHLCPAYATDASCLHVQAQQNSSLTDLLGLLSISVYNDGNLDLHTHDQTAGLQMHMRIVMPTREERHISIGQHTPDGRV